MFKSKACQAYIALLYEGGGTKILTEDLCDSHFVTPQEVAVAKKK